MTAHERVTDHSDKFTELQITWQSNRKLWSSFGKLHLHHIYIWRDDTEKIPKVVPQYKPHQNDTQKVSPQYEPQDGLQYEPHQNDTEKAGPQYQPHQKDLVQIWKNTHWAIIAI